MRHRDGSIVTAYTTTRHLLVDLDKVSAFQSRGLARMLIEQYPGLGDCLVVRCGDYSHHLVFDNILPFEYLNRVILLLWDLRIVNDEVLYFREQRGDFSLRVSQKLTENTDKTCPQPVFYLSNNMTQQKDSMIREYLKLLSIFNSSVSDLLQLPLMIFPVIHRISPDLQLHDLLTDV